MSSTTAESMKYASTHEWLMMVGDGVARVGISDHAREALGDIVFVELPKVGTAVRAGQEVGVVESVKTASDIYSPVSGEVISVNERLIDAPELINSSPEGEGWLFSLKLSAPAELDDLLNPDAYEDTCR